MRLSLYLSLLLLFFACSTAKTVKTVLPSTKRFPYIVSQQSPFYSQPSAKSEYLPDLMPGDTIDVLEKPKKINRWNLIDHNGLVGYSYSPSVFSTTQPSTQTKSVTVFSSGNDLRDGPGIGIGYGLNSSLQIELLYKYHRHMFRVGYTRQFNGQLGELKTERLSNYGTTVIGKGTYFAGALAGYDFWLTRKVAVGVDACLGSEKAYRNYSDKRFKAGGYHMVDTNKLIYGFGGKVNYLATKALMISSGYNYITGVNFSVYLVPYGLN